MSEPAFVTDNDTDSALDSRLTIREQLRLFAFEQLQPPPDQFIALINAQMDKRERLQVLLQGDLDFHGEKSGYASHDLHAFAAKFPPQLPRVFIRGLTEPGDLILDPMMGSGTTIVEALLEKRRGIGFDIDPLALQLCHVKTNPVNVVHLRAIGKNVISRAVELAKRKDELENNIDRLNGKTRSFIDYWFTPDVQKELSALILAIQEVESDEARRFLKLAFSSIVITKSGGVSLARDLAHSRPHLDKTKKPKSPIEQFSLRLRKNLTSIAELSNNKPDSQVIHGDARIMPLADNAVDLIVTSPPYANAIDYMRAHKFSLVWFGESVDDLSELRSQYIGSERTGDLVHMRSMSLSPLGQRTDAIIGQLAQRDKKKAAILEKYFFEMRLVLTEMYRVLKNDAVAIVVVGTSFMRNLDVQTHLCLADIAAMIGFDVVDVVKRNLDRNKRLMPARFSKATDSTIEQRMHEEYVIALYKP